VGRSSAEAELVQSLKAQLHDCAGFLGDELAKHRKESLDYYHQRARGDEQPGRSRVVAGTESAMVEANLAQMMDAFTSTRVVDYKPLGAADKEQAALESDTVTYFVMEANNGWIQLSSAIKDALQLRNGIIKAWIETRREVRYETYRGVKNADAAAELTNRPGVDCKLTKKWTPKDGLLELRCTRQVRKFRCEAIALENFLYPKDYDSHDLQSIPFCAERRIDSRSELIALGFDAEKVEKLKATRQRVSFEGAARNPQSTVHNSVRPVDRSQDSIEWYEIYHLHDKDGDGIAERRRVCLAWSDGVILSDVPVNLVPYASGVVLLNQHRLTGISMHDKLKQVQDKETGLDRALFDNINATNKNRTASLDGAVNPEDLADGRHNGNIRVNRRMVADVRQAVMAFAVPDTSANILQNKESVKRERAELGGAALDMASGNMQLNERMGSEGVDRVYSVMEQLAALMTRNVAATLIRNVWILAHATLREGWNEPSPIEADIQWQNVPTKWRERVCVNVKPGMSPGERTRLQNALAKFLDWQVTLAREGMDEVLVYLEGFYKALMDWGRVAEIPNPEQYFRNPASETSQKAVVSKRKQAAQIEEQKQQLMRQAIGLEQLRTAVEKYAGDADRQFKYWDAVLKAQVEEAKIVGHATTELIKAKEKPAPEGGAKSTATGARKRAATRRRAAPRKRAA
jgi:hypothetical protein